MKLETRILGRTGLEVTRIGLGTIPIIRVTFDRAIKIINAALDGGINYIDTASRYQTSEEKIGEVMKKRRKECYLATKVRDRSGKSVKEEIRRSFKLLQTDYIDVFQLHDVSTWQDWEEVMAPGGAYEELLRLRDRKKIGFIGITGHNMEVLKEAIKSDKFDTILCAYNVLTPEPADEVIPLAKKHNIGVINMKTNAGGIPHRYVIFKGKSKRPSRITIEDTMRWAMSNPDIDCFLCGPKLVKEIKEDIRIAKRFKPMTEKQRQKLLEYVAQLQPDRKFCQDCGYCEPCPAGIPIRKIMTLYDKAIRVSYQWPLWRKEYKKFKKDFADCLDCGKCEEKCPQKLPIRQRLKEAKQRLDKPV